MMNRNYMGGVERKMKSLEFEERVAVTDKL